MELSASLTARRRRTTEFFCLRRLAAAGIASLVLLASGRVLADGIVALYRADWAGLPAAQIRLELDDASGSYRDRIEIRSDGLPRLFTHFRGTAQAVGRLAPGRPANPARYEALYDLRKRRNSRIDMNFVRQDGAVVAERSLGDTSRKPPLAARYRRDIVDPLSAVEWLRASIAASRAAPGSRFVIPVYDGTRRFDVLARILPPAEQTKGLLRVELNLRPIAGFRGESSDDGDPEDAPRPVALTLTDDTRLLPVTIAVRVFYLPLVVRLERVCPGSPACS